MIIILYCLGNRAQGIGVRWTCTHYAGALTLTLGVASTEMVLLDWYTVHHAVHLDTVAVVYHWHGNLFQPRLESGTVNPHAPTCGHTLDAQECLIQVGWNIR